jgi:hypothetical protein
MRKRRLVMAAGLAAASSYVLGQEFKISRGPEVKVSQDEDVDFTGFKTFAWVDTQEPAENAANHVRITKAVERELEARGLKPAGDAKPDLRVHYFAKIEKKLRGAARQGDVYRPTPDVKTVVDFSRVTEGTLILELLVDGSRLVVWRAVASEPVGPPDEAEAQINRLVKAMVERYPQR